MDIWETLKDVLHWIIAPFAIVGWYFVRTHVTKVAEIEKQGIESKADIKVLQTQMTNLKEDIVEIKLGINKLLELERDHGRGK